MHLPGSGALARISMGTIYPNLGALNCTAPQG